MQRAASVLILLALTAGATAAAAQADGAYEPAPAPAAATAATPAVTTVAPSHYESTAGRYRDTKVFSVTYKGSSKTDTTYRATPPHGRNKPDRNTAHDTSRQTWSLAATTPVTIPTCAATDDPCAAVTGTQTADGKTTATGTINHVHVDGVHPTRNSSAKCSVTARSVPTSGLAAPISVTYDPARAAFVVTAGNPVGAALANLPSRCPSRPNGIAGLRQNYFMPGFSLSTTYGPGVWFKTESFVIPANIWHYSATLKLHPKLTTAARPPAACGGTKVRYPRVCRTTGSWSGTLLFTAER